LGQDCCLGSAGLPWVCMRLRRCGPPCRRRRSRRAARQPSERSRPPSGASRLRGAEASASVPRVPSSSGSLLQVPAGFGSVGPPCTPIRIPQLRMDGSDNIISRDAYGGKAGELGPQSDRGHLGCPTVAARQRGLSRGSPQHDFISKVSLFSTLLICIISHFIRSTPPSSAAACRWATRSGATGGSASRAPGGIPGAGKARGDGESGDGLVCGKRGANFCGQVAAFKVEETKVDRVVTVAIPQFAHPLVPVSLFHRLSGAVAFPSQGTHPSQV
jgi:hypothetical protein